MSYSRFTHIKSYLAGFYKSYKEPLEVQKELLFSLLKKNAKTQYGITHKFSSITTLEEFQKIVPQVIYEDIKPYIDAIATGATNVLTADEVLSFAVTSGSTSAAKLIPVTKARKLTFFRDLAYYGSLNPGLLKDKMLYIAGPRKESESPAGIPIGSISGYLVSIQPWFIKQRMVVPVEVYDILDIDKKLEQLALYSLEHRFITHLSFSSCVEAMLFFDYLKTNKKKLLAKLDRKGKIFRVARLKKLDDFVPAKIWPYMKNLSCVLSAGNKSYFPAMLEKFGRTDVTIRDPGVLASEGRLTLTVEIKDHVAYGIPTVMSYVYEFCEQKKDGSFKQPVFIDKIKKGSIYKMLLTSQEGLYRYEMDDLFEVVRFEKKLPILRFVSRTKCLNMAGELAAYENIVQAAEEARAAVGLSAEVSFLVLPWFKESNGHPSYDVLLGADLSVAAAKKFAKVFDQALFRLVYPYKRMRTFFGRIQPPRVSLTDNASFLSLQRELIASSRGQPKPLLVSSDESLRQKFAIKKVIQFEE